MASLEKGMLLTKGMDSFQVGDAECEVTTTDHRTMDHRTSDHKTTDHRTTDYGTTNVRRRDYGPQDH